MTPVTRSRCQVDRMIPYRPSVIYKSYRKVHTCVECAQEYAAGAPQQRTCSVICRQARIQRLATLASARKLRTAGGTDFTGAGRCLRK